MNVNALLSKVPFNKEFDNGGHQTNSTNGNGTTNGNGHHLGLDSVDENSEKLIVNLDTVIEKYIQWAWELSKNKQQSKYDYDELNITVDWARVEFAYDEPKFEKTSSQLMPHTQTLFKTHFTNKTDLDQEYSFKTERSTKQTCSFSFLKGFSKDKEGGIKFKLPQELLEIGGGISTQQSVEWGKDETKEHELKWSCDSLIRVPPYTITTAELVITEQQFDRNFTVDVKIKGKITYTFSSSKDNSFIKKMHSDIVEIFNTAMDKNWIPKLSTLFEVCEKKGARHVKTILNGKCKFRFGVAQNVTLQQQNIKVL